MSAASQPELSERRWRPPRSLEVVWDPDAEELGAEVDWSCWYLTDEEDMGEGGEQNLIIRALLSRLAVLSQERGWERVHIGSDQFFAWVEHEPLVRVSPDVYLLDDPPPRPLPSSWQTWRKEHNPPRFALEIVSEESWRKDYEDNPPKYAQLGARELVIFDPRAALGRTRGEDRAALQVFRRSADSGFVRVLRGSGPARSEELDCWLVVLREGDAASLGLARDPRGANLVPTMAQARARAEQEREAAERRAAELEAELERLRQRRG